MNITVSNIAWTNEEEDRIADKLVELGVKYIEIAPTKRWEDPTTISHDEARAYVDWWASKGIKVVAFQSMLFARPDLKIFESQQNREATLTYMSKFIELAGVMGVSRMVFGSPKNRQIGDMDKSQAQDIARSFFSELGALADKHEVVLCLEPNAPQYSCDFVTTAQEGAALVHSVSSSGFKLHLDTACMFLAGDDLEQSIVSNSDILRHFHVSAPMLDAVTSDTEIPHAAAARALKKVDYDGFISIEMRPGKSSENLARVETAVKFVKDVYGG